MYKRIILFLSLCLIAMTFNARGQSLSGRVTEAKMKVFKALETKGIVISKNTDGIVGHTSDQDWLSSSSIAYAELGLIFVLLTYILFNNRKMRAKARKLSEDLRRMKIDRESDKSERDHLHNDLVESRAMAEDFKAELSRLKDAENDEQAKREVELQVQANTVVWDKPENPTRITEILYSRYADLIDGFSASELLPREDKDTVFEITLLSPNKASFRVSVNPVAQKYALSNADYFLEQTCHYDTFPSGLIVNEKPGLLSLLGGKWEIKEKATISFK